MRICSILSALVLGQLVSSCSHFNEPIFDVGEHVLVAIPFRDKTAPRNRRWYGETERGHRLVRAFRAWCENEAAGNFLRGPDADRLVASVTTGWLENAIGPRDWRELTAGIDVDLVLVGEITEFNHQQDLDVGFYRGSAEIEYQVVHARTGKTVYSTPGPRKVLYPDPDSAAFDFLDPSSKSIQKIERGLLLALGSRLGKDLYGYYDH